MSYGRPSKAERDRWAELLGDEKRKRRRYRVRATAILGIVAFAVMASWFVNNIGVSGSCPSNDDLKATWAKPAGEVSAADRATAIDDTIRCVDLTTKTREQIQAQLGDWTSVKEYRPTTKSGRAGFLVWSNGSKTDGVRVDFSANGKARSAQVYRGPASKTSASSGSGSSGSS